MLQIAKNLMYLRYFNKYEKFYSQKEISIISRIPQTHISRIENNKETPRLTDIIFYSYFFKVTTDDIIFKKYNPETKEFEERD